MSSMCNTLQEKREQLVRKQRRQTGSIFYTSHLSLQKGDVRGYELK